MDWFPTVPADPEPACGQTGINRRLITHRTVLYGIMKARLTYIPVEIADRLDDFIIERDEQVLDAVKARARDYSTLSLLKLLYQVRTNPMTFSDLYSKSRIRMKRSFLNYLHLCVDYNFVKKEAAGSNMFYSITDRGTTMLELFMQKGGV